MIPQHRQQYFNFLPSHIFPLKSGWAFLWWGKGTGNRSFYQLSAIFLSFDQLSVKSKYTESKRVTTLARFYLNPLINLNKKHQRAKICKMCMMRVQPNSIEIFISIERPNYLCAICTNIHKTRKKNI